MPSGRPAAKAADRAQSKQQPALNPVPRGEVFGFMFPFGGTVKYPHPGIVILSQVGLRRGVQKVGVVALAITHSEQRVSWKDKNAVVVPAEEKAGMGLDGNQQWVCLFEQVTAYFPDDIKRIKSARTSRLGRASEEFSMKIYEAWSDYRNSR